MSGIYGGSVPEPSEQVSSFAGPARQPGRSRLSIQLVVAVRFVTLG